MTIRILNLNTGQQLVSEMASNQDSFTLSKPFILSMVAGTDGSEETQLALFAYAPYVLNHEIEIKKDKVVWVADLPVSMQKDYLSAVQTLESIRYSSESVKAPLANWKPE